ncbi:hypothetical protein L288_09220 [Sphingobium quisquiliarum P25]|uniref:Biopolymer transportern ExbD n=1 Tax=Sphingobium quisquiliarum P25 TaxID=1329909 RepID=T0I874_9SPHN|nr:biopolymer transporter ExbD [Sphingobium quisquiliarum]EQB07865.1 hypothetical protein L288_09220 [Sphingobium quisquiliarum P25]EZP73429.1 Biopolymer transport protein ExbD/TolR [Sphingomonas paucimobilis]
MASSFAQSNAAPSERPMGEMNTTPLIDVMLVLLIMFIITIPIQTHKIGVELPHPVPGAVEPDPVKNRLNIEADGRIRWNGNVIDRLTLRQYLAASLRLPIEPELRFQPDPQARYVVVNEVLADIRRAGIKNMGFVGNERYAAF